MSYNWGSLTCFKHGPTFDAKTRMCVLLLVVQSTHSVAHDLSANITQAQKCVSSLYERHFKFKLGIWESIQIHWLGDETVQPTTSVDDENLLDVSHDSATRLDESEDEIVVG